MVGFTLFVTNWTLPSARNTLTPPECLLRAAFQFAPVLMQSLLLGACVGLVLGLGLALRAELTDRRVRVPNDRVPANRVVLAPATPPAVATPRQLGLPVLGHVPPIRVSEPAEVKPGTSLDPMLVMVLRPRSSECLFALRKSPALGHLDEFHQDGISNRSQMCGSGIRIVGHDHNAAIGCQP